MNMLVSVIVPVYNCEKYISICLDSIINQTLQDIEIVCVNDGSTDSSLDILKSYAMSDSRIVVIDQDNMGPGGARNTGLYNSSGKYVIFIDSDDYIDSTMLEKLYTISEKNMTEITICKSYELSGDDIRRMEWSIKYEFAPCMEVFSSKDVGDHIFQLSIGWAWDKLYLREYLIKNNFSFPSLKNSEDLMLAFPAIVLANRISIVYERLIYHRVNISGSVSGSRVRNPYCFIDSCMMLKQFLIDHNIYSGPIKKSYCNWVLEYIIWNIDTLPFMVKKSVYQRLRKNGLVNLEISSNHGSDYYFNPDHYDRLLRMEKQPTYSYIIELLLESIAKDGVLRTIRKSLSKKVMW